ncbi:hypothetical protein GTP46_25835 [Duganella sp. FT135W]|uniref:Uncharacterized protein n=1 Tax=Duganella flavida TaxID=2692175 RepID=A0A6L8KG39_9BURK|nr:hypothetical protein [Duganella flavida]MYM26055.1 hypothetical protein [Duganella flavida]
MIKNHIILIIFLLSGCANQMERNSNTPSNQSHQNARLPDGIWKGTLQLVGAYSDNTDTNSDGEKIEKTTDFMVTICDGKGMFWPKLDDENYSISLTEYKNDSNYGNHLIYFQDADRNDKVKPSWVETQSMLLIEVSHNVLRAQWSRSVSNPKLGEENKERNFFISGIGPLKRTSDGCPVEMLQIYKERMEKLQ